MNILLIPDSRGGSAPENPGDSNLIELDHRQSEHCRNILRVKPGDTLFVGEINGNCGYAEVVTTGKTEKFSEECVTIAIKKGSLEIPPPAPSPVALHLALCRPKMLRRMLKTAAELGVKDIHIINSSKVEKSYWQSPLLSDQSIEKCLIEGLEQSKDTVLPTVTRHPMFRPYVEDELALLIKEKNTWVAHPHCVERSINDFIASINNKSTVKASEPAGQCTHLFIGPEGGFNDFEINLLKTAGVSAFKAGDRIMRCETFLPYILGSISHFQ